MGFPKTACIALGAIVMVAGISPKSVCQDSSRQAACSKPVTLQLRPDGADGLRYSVDGQDVQDYPLDELARALNLCGSQRPLYVLADYRVPVGKLPGAVMAKLQVKNVRFFIVYPAQDHRVVEIKIVGYDSKLP